MKSSNSAATRPSDCSLWVPYLRKKGGTFFFLDDPSSTSWGHFSVWGDVVEIRDNTGHGGVARRAPGEHSDQNES